MLGTRAAWSAPAPAPGDDARGTHAHSGAQTHTEGSAPAQSLGARASRRELVSMANTEAGWYERRRGRPPVRRSGGRVVSALFFSRAAARRRSPAPSAARCPPSAGRCRSPPARSGAPARRVMRRASSRGSTSISPRELQREPGAQADSSARDALGGSRRRKGRTLEMRAMDIGEPAARTRSSRSRIRCRASCRRSRLSGKSRPSLRASPEKVPA
jgi:hypothetical protein